MHAPCLPGWYPVGNDNVARHAERMFPCLDTAQTHCWAERVSGE